MAASSIYRYLSVFSDYMKPAIRMSALMDKKVIFIFTHDSIGLGEDGPTHQPVEQLVGLRSIPNLTVIRPADATETAEAWKLAIGKNSGPCALILTRQSLPVMDKVYIPSRSSKRRIYIMAMFRKAGGYSYRHRFGSTYSAGSWQNA
jgi:transketolase